MERAFGKVGIYGVGLIGGSLGLALRAKKLARSVHGIGRNSQRLRKALEMGTIDSFSVGADDFPKDLEVLVLGTPLSIYPRVLAGIHDHLTPHTIVSDVGSAQTVAEKEVDASLPPGIAFVGAHPIAGGERSGFEAAQADLFEGAVCALCPGKRTTPDSLERIRELWEGVGSRTITLEPSEHDMLVGWTSHLPHLVASALAKTVADFAASHDSARDFAGTGFRDSTRIASGNPTMWRDICHRNLGNLTAAMRRFRDQIDDYLEALDSGDPEALFHLLTEAKRRHDEMIGNDSHQS